MKFAAVASFGIALGIVVSIGLETPSESHAAAVATGRSHTKVVRKTNKEPTPKYPRAIVNGKNRMRKPGGIFTQAEVRQLLPRARMIFGMLGARVEVVRNGTGYGLRTTFKQTPARTLPDHVAGVHVEQVVQAKPPHGGKTETAKLPKINFYTSLLYEHGSPSAEQVKAYARANAQDHEFAAAVKKLNAAFRLEVAVANHNGQN